MDPEALQPDPALEPAHAARPDRWAHRRVEPRLLAFLWTSYLFAATGLTLLSVGKGWFVTPDVYRPAARILLAGVAVGITVLWPMIRLSQEAPRITDRSGPVTETIKDLLVILVPAQAVFWPQLWLTRWPLDVVAAIAALMGAWALLTGGLLAVALSSVSTGRARPGLRALWTVVFVIIATLGTIGAAFDRRPPPAPPAQPSMMFSPITAVFEVARDRSWSGSPAAIVSSHWLAIGATALLAIPLWMVAASHARGLRRSARLH